MSNEEFKKATGGDGCRHWSGGKLTTRGFERRMWHNALDAAGYPRDAPPLSARQQKAAMAPAAKADAPKAETAPAEPAKPLGPYAPK